MHSWMDSALNVRTMITTYEGLLDLLVRARVKFVLAGGLAVCLNGFVRTTNDLDILIDLSPENIDRLAACLASFGQGYGSTLTVSDVTDEPGAIRIQEEFDLDIFVRLNGKTFSDFASMIKFHCLPSGTEIPFLSAEGLIETKRGSGRDKDRVDMGFLNDQRRNRPLDASFRLDSVRDADSSDPESRTNPAP
jgi:hypothetical protein